MARCPSVMLADTPKSRTTAATTRNASLKCEPGSPIEVMRNAPATASMAANVAVRDPARDRCRNGTGHAGQRKERNFALRQMERLREQQRRRRPKEAEGAEQASVVQRPAPKDWHRRCDPPH